MQEALRTPEVRATALHRAGNSGRCTEDTTLTSVSAGGTCGSGRPALIKTLAGLRLKGFFVTPVSLCGTVTEASLATCSDTSLKALYDHVQSLSWEWM